MNHFTKAALQYLGANWHVVVASGSSAADLIDVNHNTLKSRINNERALAMRNTEGRIRASIDFTGMHLVYNLMFDRLARFGIVIDEDPKNSHELLLFVQYVFDHVVCGERNTDTFIRVEVRGDKPVIHWFSSSDELGQFSGDVALIMPIGAMIVRLAAALIAKNKPESIKLAINS